MDFIETLKVLTTHQKDLLPLLQTGGLLLIIAIVYIENGLFFGFFLPGDYLLFVTGLLCSRDTFGVNEYLVASYVVLGAFLGNLTGYYFGKYVGKNLFKKKDSFFFKQEHLVKTRLYFIKFGGNTLIISKFLPYVRTFAPILAGTVDMDFKKFVRFSLLGCMFWGYGLVLIGAFLGHQYPEIINYIHYVIIAFLIITTSIVLVGMFRVQKRIKV